MYQNTLNTDRLKKPDELEAISESIIHKRTPVAPGKSFNASNVGIELLTGFTGFSVCRLLRVEMSPASLLELILILVSYPITRRSMLNI